MSDLKGNFRIEELPARTLAYVRHVGPYQGDSALFGRLFTQAGAWINQRGLMGPGTEGMSVYHDDPQTVPIDQQRISVGFTIQQVTEGDQEVQIMELPAGKYLLGSFEIDATEYPAAWQAVGAYMSEKGIAPSGGVPIVYESYKNDPNQHPEKKHLVDIGIALG